MSKCLDTYISQYDNIMLLGDLNVESSDPVSNDFCNVYTLFSLVKEPTCFKNPDNPSCIYLFLTNRPRRLRNTLTIGTGISDFHKMVITIMKVFYKKQKPKIIQCWSYKNVDNQVFQGELNSELLKIDINNAELSEFTEIFLSILHKHAPRKQNFIRANNSNLVTKSLRKAIIKRSKIRNKYLRERTNGAKCLYNKQRNLFVSILLKDKREYFGNLNNKIVTDNRKFWKTISPLFSEKTFHRECITLKESNKTITNNAERAKTFNTFFSKIVPNLNLDSNLGDNMTNSNITDPVFCAIQKYKKHPSILKIKEIMGTNNLSFSFKFIDRKKIFNELQKLKSKKACQGNHIPVKIIKENIDINTPYTSDFNLEQVIQKLELTTSNLFEWFKNNHMKANADNCHLLVTRDTDVFTKIGKFDVTNSNEEKLLGVKIDNKLSFENHVSSLCKKARQKLHALARVVNFMDLVKLKSLMKAFITSEFNYCPLI